MLKNQFHLLRLKGYLTQVFVYREIDEAYPESLLLGEEIDKDKYPIIFMQYNDSCFGNYKWEDFLNADVFMPYVVSDKMINLLCDNNITGWKTFPIEVYDMKENYIGGYNGLSIIGRCNCLDLRQLIKTGRESISFGPEYKGYPLDIETWDGNDIFALKNSLDIFVTQRLKKCMQKAKISNVLFTDISEYTTQEYFMKSWLDPKYKKYD